MSTPSVMEVASNALRGVIVAPPGKKLVASDLSNIEGRVIAWLAGEEWKLQAFRDYDTFILDEFGRKISDGKGDFLRKGPDLYRLAYARAFRIDPVDVKSDQRQIGKVMELSMGYEGGVGAFVNMAAGYGLDLEAMADAAFATIPRDVMEEAKGFLAWLYGECTKKRNARIKRGMPEAEADAMVAEERIKARLGLSERVFCVCDSLKRLWRRAHPAIKAFWGNLQEEVRKAINDSKGVYGVGKCVIRRTDNWLRIRLPSGRNLCYPAPRVSESDQISYLGVNQYSRQWARISTYGGKLAENITQAVARDVLAFAMWPAEVAGYEIVLTVHDEIISEAPDTAEFSAAGLSKILATNPPWAQGLPLAASGFEGPRYRK